jgi:hypothetical protein
MDHNRIKMNKTNISISDAILSLCPTAQFSVFGNSYDDIDWYSEDITKPTLQEIDAELQKLQAEYDRKSYQRQRVDAYPSIEEQLDLMFHGGYDSWKAAIQAVKDQYPK